MANTISYAQLFQTKLDEQVLAGATSSWMEANAGQVIYNGGNTVKVPKISTEGLGNYDRTNGYPTGAVAFNYEDRTMEMDRAKSFNLDSNDVDETNFGLTAANVMADFQKRNVIPEIDAYRYSKLATLAITAGNVTASYTPAVADVLTKLRSDIDTVQNAVGDIPLMVSMSRDVLGILGRSSELTRQLDVQAFDGTVGGKVHMVDDCPIIGVPSSRMKSAYTFSATNGFTAASGAKTINWIICPMTTPIAVSKTDKLQIIDPTVNQTADGYRINYRKYHSLWVMDNALPTLYVNVKEAVGA